MGISPDHIQLDLGIVGPDVLEIISELISLVCITVLSVALGAKTYGERLKSINYGRFIVILVYFTSWAFSTTSAVIVSTNNNNMTSCTLGMLSCDIFYAGSKIMIYAWLVERVHLVTAVKTTRFRTMQYRIHILLLCPYIIIFALMLTYRNIYLESDGKCTIGLQLIASVPLLVYDFIFNLYLTWLFMKPLLNVGMTSRENWKRGRLYRLAKRTLVASVVSLLISFANVLVVVITQGHERGLVCLTMCTVDVTANVVAVHWVTNNSVSPNHTTDMRKNKNMTNDNMSAELTFDAAEPGKLGGKPMNYDFGSVHQSDSKINDEDCDSVRSVQNSQLSAKPLHSY